MLKPQAYWWLHPGKLTLFFLVPVYLLVYSLPLDFVVLRGQHFFTRPYFLMGLAYLLLFGFGSVLSSAVHYGASRLDTFRVEPLYLDFLAIGTIFAYLVWFGPVFLNPSLIVAVLRGETFSPSGLRDVISTVPGITTLTQLGVVYVIYYLYRRFILKEARHARRFDLYLLVISGLTLFRVVAWSERLAFIEVVIPIAVIIVAFVPFKNPLLRLGLTLGPYAGIIGVVTLFGLAEFFRSWSAFYQFGNESFLMFILSRFATYYYAALNTGAGILETTPWPDFQMQSLFMWLYEFPGLGDTLQRLWDFDLFWHLDTFLIYYGDPEFNNPSGIFMVFYDLGLAFGLLHAFGFGLLCGFLYKTFIRYSGIGVLFYPAIFIAILEIMRIFYVSGSRSFPIYLFLFVGYSLRRVSFASLKQPQGAQT